VDKTMTEDNVGNLKSQPDPNEQLRDRLKLPTTQTRRVRPDEQLPAPDVEAALTFCRGALETIGVAPTERLTRDVAVRLLTSMREGLTLKDAEAIVQWAVVMATRDRWSGYRDLTVLFGAKFPVYLASARAVPELAKRKAEEKAARVAEQAELAAAAAERRRQKAEKHMARQDERAEQAEQCDPMRAKQQRDALLAKLPDGVMWMGEMARLQAAFDLACRDGTLRTPKERAAATRAIKQRRVELDGAVSNENETRLAATVSAATFVRDYVAAHPGAPFNDVLSHGLAAGHDQKSLGRAYGGFVNERRSSLTAERGEG
jgi:hypothetical protein